MDVNTDLAIEFMQVHKSQPFFIYLATNMPHTSLVVSAAYCNPYRALEVDHRQVDYYATITNIDDNFGRLIHQLKKLRLSQSTLVVFLSDHGPVTSKADWPLGKGAELLET